MSRRPSVSIYNYPEDLNPFKDDETPTSSGPTSQMNGETKHSLKEPKHKFWTFGRSKKKQRSNSFSIKSTWSGLFGKRKDSQEVEIRKPTIATVSSTYKRGTYNGYPVAPVRSSKDQQEFDEALGTLARRRKYTLDNSSRYSSSLTVNGDPGRIYEGSPQNTTTSIMGDLTPKPPARRFGQMSPKPTDKIPPLNFNDKESTSKEDAEENTPDEIPIPPKRGGQRASQRSLVAASLNEENQSRPVDISLTDENENVPEDYVFKRFSHDAIRKSNLSINSCVSVGSTVSAYGRKKRRAPQPPRLKEPLESPKENTVQETNDRNVELEIVEPIDIARVTENIDEMTKRSREMDDDSVSRSTDRKEEDEAKEEMRERVSSSEISDTSMPKEEKSKTNNDEATKDLPCEESLLASPEKTTGEKEEIDKVEASLTKSLEIEPQVELRRDSQIEKIEIIKEVEILTDKEEYPLKRRKSSGNLSRSDSFSVKEEIEKIERQIQILEGRQQRECSDEQINEIYNRSGSRMSLQETRKNFFRNMVDEEHRVKVELKELPREQKDIKIVRLEDSPVAIEGPKEPVKIIQLHISEPIKRKPSIIVDREVNPIPKPRRHSNLGLESKESRIHDKDNDECGESRGNSL